jgi:ABC-type sugar transport system permease subunit
LEDLLFAGPALLVYTLVVVIPFALGAALSFTDWDGLRKSMSYLGFQNFVEAFKSRVFYNAVKNTLILAVVFTTIQNLLGLGLAVTLHEARKVNRFLKAVFFFPVLLSPLVVGFVWNYMYSPMYGLIDGVLRMIGGQSWTVDWLGNPDLALFSIIGAFVWYSAPFAMVIYAAGLETIPRELYEAASVDGAGGMRRFVSVTVPLIAPVTTVLVVFDMIACLKLFDMVFVMTGGGPGFATETIGVMIYRVAFRLSRMAYSTSIGVILFLGVMAITVVQWVLLRRREVEY